MLGILLILVTLFVLALPFLPLRTPFALFWYNHPEEKRHKNIFFVAAMLVLVILTVTLMQPLLTFIRWLGDLSFIRWVLSFIPTYAEYTVQVYEAVFINLLFCVAALWVCSVVKGVTKIQRPAKKKKPKKEKKSLWARFKEWLAKKKEARRLRREERRRIREEKKRQKLLKKQQKKQKAAGEDPTQGDEDPQGDEEPKDEPKKPTVFGKDRERNGLPEKLTPIAEPDDFDGKVFLLGKAPEKPKPAQKKDTPRVVNEKQEEDPRFFRKLLLKLFSLFYVRHEDGTWYVQPQCKKVAKHLRNFLILVGAAYMLLFMLLLIPVFFKIEIRHWDAYKIILLLLNNSYLYPAVALVVLTEVFWFMNGRLPEEPVEDIHSPAGKATGRVVDLNRIEQQLMQTYGEEYEIKTFNSSDVEVQQRAHITVDTSSDVILQKVLSFAESEKLLRNDEYLRGIQALQSGENVLFDAPLYTAVSMYLLPYLNIRISQGERLLVVCQSAEDVPDVIKNLRKGFCRVQHAHECMWAIHSRQDLSTDNRTDILVVTPADFLDDRFFTEMSDFAKRMTIALFADADQVVSANNYLCVIMAQRLQEMMDANSLRFAQRKMQYVFLSTRHMLNLARNLTEYFLLSEPVTDVHGESAFGSVRLYVWRSRGQGKVLLDSSAQTVQLETSIANIASQNGIPNVAMFTDNAIFSSQIDPSWLDTYDVYDRPIGFTVVSDDSYNLPSTIYTYARYLCKEASVLHVISQAYMLRDYFYDNAVRSLFERPLMEHGMATHAIVNQTGMTLLLCRLMSGVPAVEFAAKMQEYANVPMPEKLTYPEIRRLVDACLKYAFGPDASVEKHGFVLEEKMDEHLQPVTYVQIREEGLLDRMMEDTHLVTVQLSTNGVRETKTLPLFRRMLAQRYLPGQHIVVDHAKYKISKIDFENGVIYASAATSVHNVPDQYVQVREYTLTNPAAFIESCRHYAAGNTQQLHDNILGEQRRVEGVGELHSLTMVRASGALDMDSHTVAYYDSTNCPGQLNLTDSSVFSVKTDLHRCVNNAMYLRFAGAFEGHDRLTMTLSILLQEMMKTMFPDQHFCISVCPILRDPAAVYENKDEHCRRIAQMYPKLHGWDECDKGAIELLIVDDCEGGTGVLDMLFDSEAVYLSNILDMLCKYLDWLEEHPEGAYLNFGADERPALYDLVRIRELLDPFQKEYQREHDLFRRLTPDNVCVFCGKDLQTEESFLWNNRHNICSECNDEYVPTAEETALILDYIGTYLTRRFGVTLPDVQVAADEQVDISELDVEAKTILLNPAVPLTAVHMELLRQTVRLWQLENLRMTGDPEFEGQVLFVLVQYLEHLKQHSICRRFHGRALAQSDYPSLGYAALRQALMTQSHDNSFRYMLEHFRKGTSPVIIRTNPKRSTRVTDPSAVARHYNDELTGEDKEIYDLLVNGVARMEPRIDVSAYGRTRDEIHEIWTAMRYDHPEFHWHNQYYWEPDFIPHTDKVAAVKPNYYMTADERERRQREIESSVEQYLEGITDETGDFDAALQVFLNLAKELDYDSIALDRQEKQEGRLIHRRDTPDDLRNLYGALVQKKAVCAGYAIAYQYLLQRLGMEAITVSGNAGGRHAWNIIKMEGDYYHVDTTWGDGSDTDPAKNSDEPSFAYFGLSDQEILKARSVDPEPPAPRCTATACNYFVRNGLYFTAYDHAAIKERLVAFLQDGKKKRVDLRFSNAQVLEAARKQLSDNGGLSEVLRATNRKGSFTGRVQPRFHIYTAFFEPAEGDDPTPTQE